MESVNVFLDNLKKDQERRRLELSEKEKMKKEELDKLTQTLVQLRDEKKQFVQNIDKNLSSITSSKYSIQKSVQETKEDTGLPISHASRTHALEFFHDAMTFINTQDQNSGHDEAEESMDTTKLSSAIQKSTENTQKEVVKVRNKISAVGTVIESIPVLSSFISASNNPEEESQFDVSITLT